ncbi:KIN17-like protein [Wickerhamiella sorbophila]|uniref:KIN17-like protein n=1 Tax=Wickerhamiella sorbophila TaxID=45607 RepID=A0A2T0FGE3_9ASCO|nr:KIN17-like protein [Wickerhamiella sorbophila]PRT54055.1 KIN17-like protein [Wickerhamiella sorbophila]
MAKAQIGTAKYVANKLKAKGLQRLRWYCQVCEKQCRDENGFKCHTQSESHVKKMLQAGSDGGFTIDKFSKQFQHDFVSLLRMSHGDKPIGANRFYNEYIQNKDHVHMNATRWSSLAAFCQSLANQGILNVEDTPEGQVIAWIDTSTEAASRKQMMEQTERNNERKAAERALALQMARAKAAAPNEPKEPKEFKEHMQTSKTKIAFSLKTKPAAGPRANPLRKKL